ncbi:MAG TPA: hypothetical protein VHS99_15095 [Chloroflexota bacterium]|nr:hypothetical protein [Chloroflexota bacterium]
MIDVVSPVGVGTIGLAWATTLCCTALAISTTTSSPRPPKMMKTHFLIAVYST